MTIPIDTTSAKGQKFNRLIAIEFIETDKWGGQFWSLKCDCGKIIKARINHVKGGSTQSCGCLRTERIREAAVSHDMSKTKFYSLWRNLKYICLNKGNPRYKFHGKRGVNIAIKWLNFDNFKADMYKNYTKLAKQHGEKKVYLNRKNHKGDFTLRNCFWSTTKQQTRT